MQETRNITFSEFEQQFSRKLEEVMRENYNLHVTVTPNSVLKADNSNIEKKSITMKFDDALPAPMINFEKLYSDYLFGVDMPVLVGNTAKMLYASRQQSLEIPVPTKGEAMKHVRLAMVNNERNSKILKEVPHFEVGDISGIPRWYITEGVPEGSSASFIVNKKIAASMGFTSDEILKVAHENTLKHPFVIQSMDEILRKTMASDGMDPAMIDAMIPEMELPMLVITSENQLDGASCLMSEPALEEARQRLGTDEVICLPSSRHEIIMIPADERTDTEALASMVREINGNGTVAAEDFLSDNPLKWDGHKLQMLMQEPVMEAPVVEAPKLAMKMGGF